MSEPFFNSLLLAIVGAILTFLVTRYFANRRMIESEHDKAVLSNALRDDRITALQTQLAVISAAVVPISTAFQSILIKELTHYHTPELDALMKRVGPPSLLNEVETNRLEISPARAIERHGHGHPGERTRRGGDAPFGYAASEG